MASKSDFRVCVSVNGVLCRLFSVTQRKKNLDLVVSIRSAEAYREAGVVAKKGDPAITSQKYSIHNSPNSARSVNAIKHTLVLEGNKDVVTRNYTKAIKHGNNYVALYGARCPDLSIHRYTAPEDKKNVSITEFSSKKATLFYMVFVCGANAPEIDYSDVYSFEYLDFFKGFRVLVMYAFINAPSHSTGLKIHFLTPPPEIMNQFGNEIFEKIEVGYTPRELILVFSEAVTKAKKEMFNILCQEYPSMEDGIGFMERIPVTGSPLYPK